MRRRFPLLLTLSLALSSAAFAFQADVPPDRGYIKGGEYHSVRFGFTLKIPEGWEGTTAAEPDVDAAVSMAKDEASAARLKASAATNYRLLTLRKQGTRQSIQVLATDVLLFPSVKTPEDALDATEASVRSLTSLAPDRVKQESVEIKGRKVVTRWLRTTVGKTVVPQTITVFVDQDYVVQIVGTFETEESATAFDVAKSLAFAALPAASEAPKKVRTGPLNGGITGNQYKNEFFGLTLTFPDDWEVQEPEVMKRLQAMSERIQGKPAEEPDTSETAVQYLVSAMPKERGAILLLFVQDLAQEEIPPAVDYLKMIGGGMPAGEWVSEPREITIQGRKFAQGAYSQNMNGISVTHLFYVTVEKAYVLVWDVASARPELRKVGQGVVESMLFPVPAAAQNPAK